MDPTEVDRTEDRSTDIIVVAWVSTGIAIFVVGLKLYARARIVKVVGWDDFFIFLSLALAIFYAGTTTYCARLGFGRHTASVLAEEGGLRKLIEIGKWQMIGSPFNIAAYTFPNISIAILVVNLLDPQPLRARCLYGLAISQVVFAGVAQMVGFLRCRPLEKVWDTSKPGTCFEPAIYINFLYAHGALNAFTDVVLAIVPITVLYKLQIKRSSKLGVCIMMGLTTFSAIVTVIRLAYTHLMYEKKADGLYAIPTLVIWGIIENCVVITAACIPTLPPFFHKTFTSRNSPNASKSKRSFASLIKSPMARGGKLVSEVSLEGLARREYAESGHSEQRIIRTVDFSIKWDEANSGRRIRAPDRVFNATVTE